MAAFQCLDGELHCGGEMQNRQRCWEERNPREDQSGLAVAGAAIYKELPN
jgi:hypothetical protein